MRHLFIIISQELINENQTGHALFIQQIFIEYFSVPDTLSYPRNTAPHSRCQELVIQKCMPSWSFSANEKQLVKVVVIPVLRHKLYKIILEYLILGS